MKQHHYSTTTTWTGNSGTGTSSYRAYSRNHDVFAPGRPAIAASSDPAFRGDPSRYSPEELFVASISACHMLWYLHLCADNHVTVTFYSDTARATMQETADGGGIFTGVLLRPIVEVSGDSGQDVAIALHQEAHQRCFIANSVRCEIRIEPTVRVDAGTA